MENVLPEFSPLNHNSFLEVDQNTAFLGELIVNKVLHITHNVNMEVIDSLNIHGNEPPLKTAYAMLESSIIFGLTTMSMAHTQARKDATDKGARYLSLPEYSIDVLSSPAMLTDFESLTEKAQWLQNVLTKGKTLTVKTKLGTDIRCDISGRSANASPGWCGDGYEMASPPNAETNIAPLEDSADGTIVVDGSIPFPSIGLLKTPLTIIVKNGIIKSVDGYCDKAYMNLFEKAEPNSKILAEVGVGLNPNARLCGSMLEDEGCLGTLHFGFGSNCTIGGLNDVKFHLDHIIKNPTVEVDNQIIIHDGKQRG